LEAFDKLPAEINHLVSSFSSIPVVGDLMHGITQYTFWLIVSSIVLLIIMFAFAKRVAVVPRGRFANAVEYVIEYLENDVGVGILGKESWRRHLPFLGTLFMFIVVNNIIGIIPGMKPGTGTISTTAALALVVFIYFVRVGMKNHGVWGYIKSLAPKGVMFPLNILIWVIELISTLLRPITLAVRLFCNMFAGHIVLGSFALMVSAHCAAHCREPPGGHPVPGVRRDPVRDLCDRDLRRCHPGVRLHRPYRRVHSGR
jgi:F-type H+-transporting ATPase subunit a